MSEPTNITIELLHNEIVRITLAAHEADMTFNSFVIGAAITQANEILADLVPRGRQSNE